MKNSWEWDESNLLQLIKTETKESIELDFKESLSLKNTDINKNEISKDVSAFANSAGGILIYGVKENGHVAISLDGGVDPKVTTKEWLEQVINSRIHRKIDGILINQIELITTHQGYVAYVVYVPSSNRAPHQAYDKKFYKRYNFESIAMEEYEVRDIARREETPDLKIDFSLPTSNLVIDTNSAESSPFELNAAITNLAIEPANYAVIRLYLDNMLVIEDAGGLENSKSRLQVGTEQYSIHVLSKNWGIPSNLPIFYTAFRIGNNPIKLRIRTKDKCIQQNFLLGYEIHSPRMRRKLSFSFLKLFQGSLSISESYTEERFISHFKELIK